ncbi:TPA: exonuclease domain-containing protein [Serratia fonticola]|jgi:DNA polymerase III epsilon subunit-like protein|uniref:3'-5' exonuclease n=1 Tax=Serratia fonticola TaxID=47917 RepID=UPI00217A71B8|nr:3'-5' exonuclease [Serratia fonticola]CAI1199220.1 DNA polymerase III subunit epsilon [Serratia fonticola]
MKNTEEIFISVDIETSGPVPGKFSMLSIGACLTTAPEVNFYCELKPTSTQFVPAALEVTGFSLEKLQVSGQPVENAMQSFKVWIEGVTGDSGKPIFVGFNTPFDWAFINYYFHVFLGDNPFGFTALDIKALYMGVYNTSWSETRSSKMVQVLGVSSDDAHNALKDAIFQANLFNVIRTLK